MAALTETKVYHGEHSGSVREHIVTGTLQSASDTITFTTADGFNKIEAIKGFVLTGGMDAGLLGVQVSFSGLVVTLVSKGQDGAAASDWTDATFTLTLAVSDNG